MRKSMFSLVCVLVILPAVASFAGPSIPAVGALDIDFRTAPWAPADGSPSYVVGDIKATATPLGRLLYQDSTDGLGIKGRGSVENDEIEREEILVIEFKAPKVLTGVWITDLFEKVDGVVGELGEVELSDGSTYKYDGNLSDQANGEQYVDFGGSKLVTGAKFYAIGKNPDGSWVKDNEHSVAGFTVPAPSAFLLTSIGILIARRRKMS